MLKLTDLEHSKRSVLNSLASPSSQDSYEHAIDEFIGWYCSEPRLSFNRTVVLRYQGSTGGVLGTGSSSWQAASLLADRRPVVHWPKPRYGKFRGAYPVMRSFR